MLQLLVSILELQSLSLVLAEMCHRLELLCRCVFGIFQYFHAVFLYLTHSCDNTWDPSLRDNVSLKVTFKLIRGGWGQIWPPTHLYQKYLSVDIVLKVTENCLVSLRILISKSLREIPHLKYLLLVKGSPWLICRMPQHFWGGLGLMWSLGKSSVFITERTFSRYR